MIDIRSNLEARKRYFGWNQGRLASAMLSYLKEQNAEGRIPYFYLDTKGNITIGMGHKIDSKDEFLALKKYLYSDPACRYPATEQQMEKLWSELYQLIKEYGGSNYGANFYETKQKASGNILYMSNAAMDEDTLKQINQKILEIKNSPRFPNMEVVPFEAQLALLDMSYNIGANGVAYKFQNFTRAFCAFDWVRTGYESHRGSPISDARNQAVALLFDRAAQEEDNFKQFITLNAGQKICRTQDNQITANFIKSFVFNPDSSVCVDHRFK